MDVSWIGGFGAEYGGRISAIVDIKLGMVIKVGLPDSSGGDHLHGCRALLEGPIVKFKEGGTSVSYALSAKKSLLEYTTKNLYSYAAPIDSIGLPFSFTDFYGKVSVNTPNGSKFNLFGLILKMVTTIRCFRPLSGKIQVEVETLL